MNYYNSFLTTLLSSCLGVIILSVALGALFAFIFMNLWNWLVPMFWSTAPILTFWQAWGIMILLSIIGSFFKGTNNSSR